MQKYIDSFGFINNALKPSQKFNQTQISRTQKWIKMIKKYNEVYKSEKFKKRIRKGIPQVIRIQVWPLLAQIDEFKQQYQFIYEKLLNQSLNNQEKKQYNVILDDAPRTFQFNVNFNNQNGQQRLINVLKAFLSAFPDIGYTQGLNYIAAIFLLHFDEETSFWMLISYMFKYDRKQIYTNLENTYKEIYVFERLIDKYFPKIYKKMQNLQINLSGICTGWFLTNFSQFLPFISVLNIFDIFLNEPEKILYRVGLAIFKIRYDFLEKANNLEKIMYCFKEFENDPKMLPENLFEQAFSFTFSRDQVLKYENDYIKVKIEQDKINQIKKDNYKRKLDQLQKEKQQNDNQQQQRITQSINGQQIQNHIRINYSIQGNIQQREQIQFNNQQNNQINYSIQNQTIYSIPKELNSEEQIKPN